MRRVVTQPSSPYNLMALQMMQQGVVPSTLSRPAGSPGFLDALKGFAPRLPAGAGTALAVGAAGIPVVMEAANQLNGDPNTPGENFAGAGGATFGGGIGWLAGKLGGPLAPITMPLGAYVGSQLGGALARNTYDGVNSFLQGSPQDRAIRDTEKMFRSQLGMGLESLPLRQAQDDLAFSLQQRAAQEAQRLQAQQMYQQASLNSAMAPVGRYMDPNFMAALGQIGSSYGALS